MTPLLLSGSSNRPLSAAVARKLGVELSPCTVGRFPDGELNLDIGVSVRGRDVYVLQPTSPPADPNLMELLLAASAVRRAGAARVTAVVPYLGYARQDRRVAGREPVAARLVADLIGAAGFDRFVGVDLHSPALEGFFGIPVEHLTAVPLLAAALRLRLDGKSVVVAPDLGAARLAEHYAELLGAPVAIIHKQRRSGGAVSVRRIVGSVKGRRPIVVDDMISTGGTIAAAVSALRGAGAVEPFRVVATHGLFAGPAKEILAKAGVKEYLVTTSVVPPPTRLPIRHVELAPLLAAAIQRLHDGKSLQGMLRRG
ncbi:MAG: ribose-phosphate pyrophosphokinase [Planctomycetes bacterium]|nr:ribose-phosphate pyrophosphokinase [Planctomycetota bacterium]